MTIYRRSWQVLCVPLATVGASVAFVKSPVAVTFMFIYFGALGMLLTLGFVAEYWECSSGGRMRLLACGAVVGGGSACSFIGFASLLGPACLPARRLGLVQFAVRREDLSSLAGCCSTDQVLGEVGACVRLCTPALRFPAADGPEHAHR